MNTITKADLVAAVARKKSYDPREVKEIIDALTNEIICRVADGDQVIVRGFGRFYPQLSRPGRICNLPARLATGQLIPQTMLPKFRPGVIFAQAVAESNNELNLLDGL